MRVHHLTCGTESDFNKSENGQKVLYFRMEGVHHVEFVERKKTNVFFPK
jgi:hypothetical protein